MGSKPQRRRWSVWKVALVFLAALVLYVLSSGPYFWISGHDEWMGDQTRTLWSYFAIIYEPLVWLWVHDVQPLDRWLEAYWRYSPEQM